jgi:hypothetical protein
LIFYGKIVYSPKTHLGGSDNWAILSCEDDIWRYYSWLFRQQHSARNNDLYGNLSRPVWGAHVSFIRSEKVNANLGIDNGKIIEFDCEPGVIDNGEHFWLNVKCDYLIKLRLAYGLSPEPKFGYHLTVGRHTR